MGIQSSIAALEGRFTPSQKRLADAIRENPSIVLDRSISELAQSCSTSVASVVRFCRVLGLSGYAQLRMSLATELGKEAAQFGANLTLGAEIAQSDTLPEMMTKVASLEMLAIDETVTGIDYEALERIVAALNSAGRILLFGIGASQFVAQDLHHKLMRIGRNAFLLSDAHEAWSTALLSPQNTVAIGFSHSGTTRDTMRYLDLARQNGAMTIAVTGSMDSPLARLADECLVAHARESSIRAGAMVSRIAQLVLVDCLFLGIAHLSYDDTIVALKRTRDVTHQS